MPNLPYILQKPSVPPVPVLISSPHSGTELPSFIKGRMEPGLASSLPDTDWLVHELYDFAPRFGITMIKARYSRYVIDLNRDPAGQSLYADGRQETGLVPIRTFAGDSIYKAGQEPDEKDVAERLQNYFEPYHEAVASELANLQRDFEHVLFFDAHSIARLVKTIRAAPFPDLILGNQKGKTAAPSVIAAAMKALTDPGLYQVSHNDPFMGGFLTRHFGQPEKGVHALQLEMSQDIYLMEGEPRIDPVKKNRLVPSLEAIFHGATEALRCL